MENKISPEITARRDKNQNIQVFVRVRPMNSFENSKNALDVIDTPGSREVVVRERSGSTVTKTFTFDKVFGTRSKQVDVYKTVVAPLVAEVLLGYNCTVFAYGQTGTGKTFTMEGERSNKPGTPAVSIENDPLCGILPRTLSQLFDEVRLMNCEFTVRVSFLELYNEELFDLLAPIEDNKARTLRLYEDSNKKGSVIIQGLEEVIVQNKHEVYAVLERGTHQRKTASTLMNASSSRSHTVFTVIVHMKESNVEGEEMVKVGKLYLVDLAGSENIGKSGAVDKRAREAGSINQSLLTLGRVISALVERTPHIPYRESKLTRLLQDSLGGKTKTSIIATVSPASMNIEETLSTLEYAHRAKNIMNKPEVNQKLTKKEALNIYTEEIERLRRDLNATREKNGVFVDPDNYNKLHVQIESQHKELNEKSNTIRELQEANTEKDEELTEANKVIDTLKDDLQANNMLLQEYRAEIENLNTQLGFSCKRNNELEYLVNCQTIHDEKLQGEAGDVLCTAKSSVAVIEKLHSRLDRKTQIAAKNWTNSQRFREDIHESLQGVGDKIEQLRRAQVIYTSDINAKIDEHRKFTLHQASEFVGDYKSLFSKLNGIEEQLINLTDVFVGDMTNLVAGHTGLASNEFMDMQRHANEALDSINGMIQGLKGYFIAMKGELTKAEEDIGRRSADLHMRLVKPLTSDLDHFNKLGDIITELSNSYILSLDKMCTIVVEWEEMELKYKNKLKKYQSTMRKAFDEFKEDTDDYFVSCASANEAKRHLVKTDKTKHLELLEYYKQSVTDAKEIPDNAIQAYQSYRIAKDIEQKTHIFVMAEKLKNCLETAIKLDKQVCLKSDLQNLQLTALMENFDNYTKKTKSTTHTYGSQFNPIVKAQGDVGKEICDLNEIMFTKLQQSVLSGYGEFEVDANLQLDNISDGCSSINRDVQQVAGNMNEFWDITYLRDMPTGVTPRRKEVDLPDAFTTLSPHDRILGRFRNHKLNVDDVLTSAREMRKAMGVDEPLDSQEEPVFNIENQSPSELSTPRDADCRSSEEKEAPKGETIEGAAAAVVSEAEQQAASQKSNKRKAKGKKGVLKTSN